jgi:hypothetical protein
VAQLQIPSPSRYAVSDDPEDTCTNAIVKGVIIWQNCNTARGLDTESWHLQLPSWLLQQPFYSIGLHLHAVAHPNKQRENKKALGALGSNAGLAIKQNLFFFSEDQNE